MSATNPHEQEPDAVDAVALRKLLDGPPREVREHTRAVLARPAPEPHDP